MNNKKVHDKMVRARTSLLLNHPFFASLALRLELREDYSCETAWTDGTIFAYNPSYVDILSQDKLDGLTAHTVMHPACGHHKRRQGRDHDVWNRACDYSINWILMDAGLVLPEGFLYCEEFRGKSADEIYGIIWNKESEKSEKQQQRFEGVEDDSFAESLNEKDKNSGKADGEKSGGEDGAQDNEINEESSDGEVSPDAGDPGRSGEVRDFPENEREGVGDETDWEIALVQAALHARGCGKMPVGIDRFIQNIIDPKLPWQDILDRFIENSARSDYSWMSPNRRFIHRGLYLPSLRNDELSEIVIVVDTSGSIIPREMDRFAAEISEIMEVRPSRIHLVYCDRSVLSREVFERADLPVLIEPRGGGGTDYRPAFEEVERFCIDPACLIYLTDLECRSFPDEPHYPVLWVKTGEGGVHPPFGEVICM